MRTAREKLNHAYETGIISLEEMRAKLKEMDQTQCPRCAVAWEPNCYSCGRPTQFAAGQSSAK